MNFTYDIQENVSSMAMIAEQQFPFLMQDALRRMGNEIKKSVKDEFENSQSKYSNRPTTAAYKAQRGFSNRALEETGALKDAVTNWGENEIKVLPAGNSYNLRVEWTLPQAGMRGVFGVARKKPQFVYLWAHESGAENITNILARRTKGGFTLIKAKKPWTLEERPFFINGIDKGIDNGSRIAAGEIYAAIDLKRISDRAPYVETGYRMKRPPGMGGIFPKLLPGMSISSLIWYVVPPSQLYAVIGMSSDIMGFLKGSFFSFGMFGGYARQMAWGQVGMTKKIYRRRFRAGLWNRD
jgi:hypothetical protein